MANPATHAEIEAAGHGLFIAVCNKFVDDAHRAYAAVPVLLQPHDKRNLPSARKALKSRKGGLPCLITSTTGDQGPQVFTYFGWVADILDNENEGGVTDDRSEKFVYTTVDDSFYGSGEFARIAIAVEGPRPIWPHIPVLQSSSLKGLTAPSGSDGPDGWTSSGSISRAGPRCLHHELLPLLSLMIEQRTAVAAHVDEAAQ